MKDCPIPAAPDHRGLPVEGLIPLGRRVADDVEDRCRRSLGPLAPPSLSTSWACSTWVTRHGSSLNHRGGREVAAPGQHRHPGLVGRDPAEGHRRRRELGLLESAAGLGLSRPAQPGPPPTRSATQSRPGAGPSPRGRAARWPARAPAARSSPAHPPQSHSPTRTHGDDSSVPARRRRGPGRPTPHPDAGATPPAPSAPHRTPPAPAPGSTGGGAALGQGQHLAGVPQHVGVGRALPAQLRDGGPVPQLNGMHNATAAQPRLPPPPASFGPIRSSVPCRSGGRTPSTLSRGSMGAQPTNDGLDLPLAYGKVDGCPRFRRTLPFAA